MVRVRVASSSSWFGRPRREANRLEGRPLFCRLFGRALCTSLSMLDFGLRSMGVEELVDEYSDEVGEGMAEEGDARP